MFSFTYRTHAPWRGDIKFENEESIPTTKEGLERFHFNKSPARPTASSSNESPGLSVDVYNASLIRL